MSSNTVDYGDQSSPRLSILVLEEDPTIQDLLWLILRDGGFEPLVTSSLDDATAIATNEVLGAIIADFVGTRMPHSDPTILRTLEQASPNSAVILCTARTGFESLLVEFPQVIGVITRPFDIDDVLAIVGSAIQGMPRAQPQRA